MNEYKGIINEMIINIYNEILVIDIMEDKLYKYLVQNNNISYVEEVSYMKYLNDCKEFVYEDDINNYVDSLSISRLENEVNGLSVNYKMKDNKIGTFLEYTNNVRLYDKDDKKIIVVLVSLNKNSNCSVVNDIGGKSILENKHNKTKIYNIFQFAIIFHYLRTN